MARDELVRGLILLLGCACAAAMPAPADERARIDLNGEWQFRLDPNSEGEAAEWHSAAARFTGTIQVPGCWQAQGFGEPSGVLRNHYSGKAWYRRGVTIPADWKGKRVALRIGGVLRRATVFVNGRKAGEHDGFSTPFAIDVSDYVRPGARNTIALLVANPGGAITESPDAQKAAEPTGLLNYIANWGGIYGKVELEAASAAWIDEVAITTHIQKPQASFIISVRSRESGPSYPARVEVSAGGNRGTAEVVVQPGGTVKTEVAVDMPGARLWSPDNPHLYTASIRLFRGDRELDSTGVRFGMREIITRGNVLRLNGKPLYLRGYGDDNVEVLTGVPPACKEIYLERLRLARNFGFNAVRFHSMTPVREYFEAADEVGLLVMAELPAAYTMYVLPHKQFLKNELERVLREHRNHPSFMSLAFGNEFNLNWLKTDAERKEFQETISDFYRFAKSVDPNRIILSNDGLLLRPTDMASLFRDAPKDIPAVRHEFGNYYCSLPDIDLIGKFNGVLVPVWLEKKKSWVDASGLAAEYPVFVRHSQLLLNRGRKYQIERARRLQEFTGYHYWLIVDFPGGTGEGDSWEEGWFDYFWRPKNVLAEEGRELNSAVLLMIGTGVSDRTMWNDSRKRIEVFVSNYGEEDISGGVLEWKLMAGARKVGGGTVTGIQAPLGKVQSVAEIVAGPVGGDEARKLELVVELKSKTAAHVNRWDLWVFPRQRLLKHADMPVVSAVRWSGIQRLYPFIKPQSAELDPPALLITSVFDLQAARFLDAGGRVLLLADRAQFERGGDATFFPPPGGSQGTILRDHPALSGFPHDGFCDLQFFNLLEGAWNFSLNEWPKSLVPIAGGIRTTSSFLSKQKDLSKTGYIFEVKAGRGRLLVSTLRLREHIDEAYPEAVFLFDRLLHYASGKSFDPVVEAAPGLLERLLVR